MGKKTSGWKTKGMNRDMSVSAFNPEFCFENRNLRLSTNENNTLMSWVNERSTASISIKDKNNTAYDGLLGRAIGTAVLNHQLVVFTHRPEDVQKPDYIYKLEYSGGSGSTQMTLTELYNGDLEFDLDHPLETKASYEADNIQKVYWTDNKNQPRMINIANPPRYIKGFDPFAFVPELKLGETIYVKKILGASGTFAPGVIQYAFTYFNKYGQESNIFYTSPLYYISFKDRGGAPDEKVDNAFKITVKSPDSNFEYLRIYSIHRTSIDSTPLCKRIQDITIYDDSNKTYLNKISYLDTGTVGDTIDPTELLYKGGEPISVKTMDQKDGTLFMGNLTLKKGRPSILDTAAASISIEDSYRKILPLDLSSDENKGYNYASQLTSVDRGTADGIMLFGQSASEDASVPCAGFKYNEYYRFGVQFQDKYGRWSEPVVVRKEKLCGNHPSFVDNSFQIKLPIFKGTVPAGISNNLISEGYGKVRGVMAVPGVQDRDILCQGVGCPTLFTEDHRENIEDIYAQSSWFFRPYRTPSAIQESKEQIFLDDKKGIVCPAYPVDSDDLYLPYTKRNIAYDKKIEEGGVIRTETSWYPPDEEDSYNPAYIRRVEIEGSYNSEYKFQIDTEFITLHSPDIEFDSQMQTVNYMDTKAVQVGNASIDSTLSDINIQTETPTISSKGSGFIHKTFYGDKSFGIVSGLFYEDYAVDDNDDLEALDPEKSPIKWLVYPWNASGSLNNDINRPADKGTATAILKKKVISNLRISNDTTYGSFGDGVSVDPEIFNSDVNTFVKTTKGLYQGNVDMLLSPDNADGKYFSFGDDESSIESLTLEKSDVKTPFFSKFQKWWKTFGFDEDGAVKNHGYWKFMGKEDGYYKWKEQGGYWTGEEYTDLVLKKNSVRMKYKSTPHLVFNMGDNITWSDHCLPVIDIKNPNVVQRYGGDSEDALKENVWIPCGEPVKLGASSTPFYYSYGDTYYQRWDCLKTYAFTFEDPNQIVEIGSFMLETRTNIDGRYDRNRGQLSNINMSPINFNLINPVYSQINNFFSYKILDRDSYINTEFPNQITWSKTKQAGADIDMWTNVTMASILEMDGDKGRINKLIRFNDQLLSFQDTGIAALQYNDNVLISSQDGVPIEISNSDKVRGKQYISSSIGCSNKWSVVETPSGVYFMDAYNKEVYMYNGQMNHLSTSLGFNTWAKDSIPNPGIEWKPAEFGNFVSYYDKLNQEVLFVDSTEALAYSEKFGAFTSFYDYGTVPYFNNFDDTGVWIKHYYDEDDKVWYSKLWKHRAGSDYCNFFGAQYPFYTILVGNPEPQMDKIFTNLEFRAVVDGEGTDESTPYLPFNTLETWNEYQHGITTLSIRNGHSAFKHHDGNTSSLKRKFRIWRCDIPRDNAALALDTGLNIHRFKTHPNDRMRNPWLYLKLMKSSSGSSLRTEVHDVVMTYFE